MANIQHKNITDAERHEPKGISTAAVDTVYVSNGSATGVWKELPYSDTSILADVSTASSIIIPIPVNVKIQLIRFILGGAITTADSVVSITRGGDSASLGSVTIVNTGSAAGTIFDLVPISNNVINSTSNGYIKITTDGGSTNTVPLYVSIKAKVV